MVLLPHIKLVSKCEFYKKKIHTNKKTHKISLQKWFIKRIKKNIKLSRIHKLKVLFTIHNPWKFSSSLILLFLNYCFIFNLIFLILISISKFEIILSIFALLIYYQNLVIFIFCWIQGKENEKITPQPL